MPKLTTALLMSVCMYHLAAAGELKHSFVVVDNGAHRLCYVDQFEPANSWSVRTDPKPRDIRLSADGTRILVSVDRGAVEYDLASGEKSGFAITNHIGIQSAQRLNDGNYLLAAQERIFVCAPSGKELKRIPVAAGSTPYIRIVTLTGENTLLYTAKSPYCINEVDMEGKRLATVQLPDKSYKAVRLTHGNYLASSGDSVSVFEVTPAGAIVRTYGGKEAHPELDLSFNSGWQQLANGNIVATCWHGHGYKGNGPHLVEYTGENQVVWSWRQPEVQQVTNVLVLK